MNDKGVCRTAPATPVLLIMSSKKKKMIFLYAVRSDYHCFWPALTRTNKQGKQDQSVTPAVSKFDRNPILGSEVACLSVC